MGKTETVKDFARLLGRQCIVINCSDQMSHATFQAIFKGGLGSGDTWLCFDEFNRVVIEVLCSVALQLR